jgi:iron complex outermembrane receptor protein
MRIEKINKLTSAVQFALAVGAAFAVNAAIAQDNPPASSSNPAQLESVTVTGTRIRSVDVETAQPVTVITQADIQKSGLVTVGDILNRLTIAGAQTFSKAAVLASNPEAGGQYINIYNLGTNRTLVLVNGKRWATSLDGLSDVSTIPASLIDHMDILKDGASAIYGSDAVAGVVNIILKDRYSGMQASAYYGQNDGDDGATQQFSFSAGTVGDRSAIMFGAEYNKSDPVWAKTREATRYTYGPNHASSGFSGTSPWGFYQALNPATLAATGSRHVINHTGGCAGDGVGVAAASNDPNNYHVGQNGCDLYNPTLQMQLAGQNTAKTMFVNGSYDITDAIKFKSTIMYNERDNSSQVAGYPFNSRSQPVNPIFLDPNSYYNPVPGQTLYVATRNIDLPRITTRDVKSLHFDAGLEGSFDLLGSSPWNWDAGFNYNKYNVNEYGSGNLNLVNMRQALGPSFLNSNGVVQCGTPDSPIALSQCVPYNILGGPNAWTPAQLNYINENSTNVLQSVDKEFTVNVTGPLFTGWAGDISVAAGYEHRQVSGYFHIDTLVAAGLTTDLAAQNTDSSYHTDEFYAELNVPLLKDVPGAKELSIDLAGRYSKYSDFGNTTNPRFSLTWKPIDDLMVRGSYGKGFRAPTIGDLAGGGSQTFDYYTDPCDTRFGAAATSPTVAAKCAAQGLPANFRQIATTGLPVTAANSQGITPFVAGTGNAYLQPEYSKSRTAGFVYSPQWLDGLNVSIDWYKIRVTNMITSTGSNYVLNQCYIFNNPTYCGMFSRDPSTGQVVDLHYSNINLAAMSTEGWNGLITYRLPETPIGQFTAKLDANYLTNFEEQNSPGTEVYSSQGQWSYPRWRANVSLDWTLGDFGATWGLRYYGAFRDACWDVGVECNQPNYESPNWPYGIGANRVGAIVFNDLSVRYHTPWKGDVTVGVNNIFDRHRPITYTVGNSNPAYYDPALDTDRYFFARYTQQF